MPSPRPVKPSFSVVFAFTLMSIVFLGVERYVLLYRAGLDEAIAGKARWEPVVAASDQVAEVVDGHQSMSEELSGLDQMSDVRAREPGTRVAITTGLERVERLSVHGVLDIEPLPPGKERAVPGEPRRQHTVEHVDTGGDDLQEADRVSYAHEVTGFAGG